MNLTEIIKASKNIVFFGGAGVSTESDIPDFRSEGGLYSAVESYGHPPEYLLSRSCLVKNPQLFFQYYKENLIITSAKPNKTHYALAQLEEMGLLKCVITQNIDGLHQAAGSKNVLELHGKNNHQHCDECYTEYDLAYILERQNCDGFVPKCSCGGFVRPGVVLYGENLDEGVLTAAVRAVRAADCLIVGGTSLVVYPAASLIYYLSGGGRLVLINKSSTPHDSRADLVINDSIGAVLDAAVQEIISS